jgi:gas vesicle protein
VGRDNDANGGSVMIAFFLGAMVGAAVALLWAPGPGEETRRRLSERAREGRERATDAAHKGREFVQKQRETVSSAIERGKEAYQEARSPEEPA